MLYNEGLLQLKKNIALSAQMCFFLNIICNIFAKMYEINYTKQLRHGNRLVKVYI